MPDFDPEKLKQFLFDHVETLDELQVLVWFRRHPGAAASDAMIAQETGISLRLVTEALERMASSGLLSSTGTWPVEFRYAPSDAALHEALQRVLAHYEDDPHTVMQLMTANAIERLRGSAMRAFADAFRIRKN